MEKETQTLYISIYLLWSGDIQLGIIFNVCCCKNAPDGGQERPKRVVDDNRIYSVLKGVSALAINTDIGLLQLFTARPATL